MSVTVAPPRARVRVMTVNHAVDLYLGELARQGKAYRTIDTYRRLLNQLTDAYTEIEVEELTITQLRRFLDRRATNTKSPSALCSPHTVAQRVSILSAFFGWLYDENYIPVDPSHRLKRPKLARPEENDGIVSVSTDEAKRMLAACENWREKLCLHVLVYTGGRRRAVANLRLSDYDPAEGTLRFEEKGGKTIKKPVPGKLAGLLNEAYLEGVWEDAGDDPWLIPPRGFQGRARTQQFAERRGDRIVYETVVEVAKRAGVRAHVHALRAAFAVLFLEQKPNQVVALKDLMGHARLETTQVYLRRLNRRRSMEAVRDLDWDAEPFEALSEAEKEGFEPSNDAKPAVEPSASNTELAADLLSRASEASEPPISALDGVERAGPHPGGSGG